MKTKSFALGFTICLVLFLAVAASAAPVPCPTSGSGAGGTPSYADLIATNAGGGCFIADKVFSGFTFLPNATGGATALTANQINYTLDNLVPSVMGTVLVGFEFGMSLSAGQGQSNTVTISLNIAQLDGIADITSVHDQMVGVGLNGGVASVAESFCLGAFNMTGCQSGTPQTLVTSNPGISHEDAFFSGVSRLSIVDSMNASGFNGTANLSGVRVAIDETRGVAAVPEPASLSCLLVGAALFSLAKSSGRVRRRCRV